MSDIKLFRTNGTDVTALEGRSVALEKSLQKLIEENLETFLGIRFLATEYSTGKKHGGRIDTLGIDENGCPVIIEYKRSSNENVINQGLFYLDWLLDHKGEFQLLVLDRYGKDAADAIEWSSPRLLCIAGDFTRYDEHAVQQINRNIELMRYLRFGEELLLLELVNAVQATTSAAEEPVAPVPPDAGGKAKQVYKTVSAQLEEASEELRDLYEQLESLCLSLGDDVQKKVLKWYFAYKRIRNFTTVEIRNNHNHLLVHVRVDPDSIELEEGFTRDVRQIGHLGTGDLEIVIHNADDLEKARPLIEKSYEAS